MKRLLFIMAAGLALVACGWSQDVDHIRVSETGVLIWNPAVTIDGEVPPADAVVTYRVWTYDTGDMSITDTQDTAQLEALGEVSVTALAYDLTTLSDSGLNAMGVQPVADVGGVVTAGEIGWSTDPGCANTALGTFLCTIDGVVQLQVDGMAVGD